MPSSSSTTLLTLPPEIRNQIWQLAVHHTQTGGLICPVQNIDARSLPTANPLKYLPQHNNSHILVSNIRIKITNEKPFYPPPHLIRESQIARSSNAPATCPPEALRASFEGSPQGRSGHFCTLSCLTQPALTRVSRQVRAESLGFFYRTNHFHLELDNFAPSLRSSLNPLEDLSILPSPRDWYRTLPQPLLQQICRFSIAGQAFFAYEHNALMLDFDFAESKAEMLETHGAAPRYRYSFAGEEGREELRKAQVKAEERLRELLSGVVERGLSVEVLDEVTNVLERWDG